MSVKVGTKLEATNGVWRNNPTSYTYQWERGDEYGEGWAEIAGKTGPTYTVVEADKKHTLRCAVTAKNTDGTTVAHTTCAVVGDERTDFARTFAYGEPGVTGVECVVACFPASEAGKPCVVLVHGGGWDQQTEPEEPKGGEKTEVEQTAKVKAMTWVSASKYAEKFREKGWAVFVMNFRQSSATVASYNKVAVDLGAMIDFIKLNAGLFNGDGSKVCVVGSSSGGTYAQMAATRVNKAKPGFIKACASLSGDFPLIALVNECIAKKEEMISKAEEWKVLEFHFENMAHLFGETQAHMETPGYIAAHADLKEKMELFESTAQVDANAAWLRAYISAAEFPPNTPAHQGVLMKEAYEALGLGARFVFTEVAGSVHGINLWTAGVRDEVDTFMKAHV